MEDTDYSDSIFILYGSQTGNAEGISRELTDCIQDISSKNIIRLSLNELIQKYTDWDHVLKNSFLNLIVCSTTGDGDIPDNADRFYRKIKSRKIERNFLQSCPFVFLALGDTNYSQFCGGGKKINKRMIELGAKEIQSLTCIDEVGDMEEEVELWINNITQKISDGKI
tara:strand:- start:5762 stop:6265 length:504 start_codon:yes stop_codon:yes gene_type:complete